jgi:hypothetical protein
MVWLGDYHCAMGSCSIYSIHLCFMADLGRFLRPAFSPSSKLVRESPILNRVRKTTLTVLN